MRKLLMIIGIAIGFLPAGFAHAQGLPTTQSELSDEADSVIFSPLGITEWTVGDGEVLDFGGGGDMITLSGIQAILTIDGGRIDFGTGNDKIILQGVYSFLTLKNGGMINFGTGNDELTISDTANIVGDEGGGTINFGAGNDKILNDGDFQSGSGSLVVDLGDGDDVFINRNIVNNISIKFGAGDDVFINEAEGSATLGSTLSFGDGYDRLINEGVIIFESPSIQSQFVFEQGASGSFSLVTGFEKATTAPIFFTDLESLLLDGVVNLDFTGTAPAEVPAEYRVIGFHREAAVHIASGFRLVISETNLGALGIANVDVIPTISSTGQFITLREDPSIAPARIYDIAEKASLDCDTALVCKGSTESLSSFRTYRQGEMFSSETFTLDANGFAVEGGHTFFASPASTSPMMLTLSTAVDSKVQVHGLIYVGDVRPQHSHIEQFFIAFSKLVFGENNNHAFANISGGGNFELTNYGGIIGSGAVLITLTDLASAKIYNEGFIQADKVAIAFDDATGSETFELTNKGSIRASGEVIHIDGGVATIDNEGSIYSSILAAADRHSSGAINAAIAIDSAALESDALVIINRKNGRIIYDVGATYSGAGGAGAAVFVNNRSDANLYNEGFIFGRKGRTIPSASLTAHGIIWKDSTGILANRGGIYGKDETIKIEGASDITLYNKGIIKSANKAAIEIGGGGDVTLTNYGNGEISGNSYGINALAYSGVYITNLGEIRAATKGGVALSFRQNAAPEGTKGAALIDTKTFVYNLGDIIGATGIYLAGGGVIHNHGANSLIYGADKAIHITHGRPRYDGGAQRNKITIFNAAGAKINSPVYGIYVDAAQNTDFILNNRGDVSGDGISGYGLYVDIDETKSGASFNGAKLTITNHVRGGIYGRSAGVRIVNILDNGKAQTVDEKITIQNAGGILGRDIGILIDEPISFLDITNEASGVIVGENIAIQMLSGSPGGANSANYLITNKGHLLSDTIALHNPGQGYFLNQGFTLGDIILAGDGSTLTNRPYTNNNFNTDLCGIVGERSYSFVKEAIGKVAPGVIVGNIYFYDKDVGEASSPDASQQLYNYGVIYGNVYFGKGDTDRYRHFRNARVEGTVWLGDGADFLIVERGGTMYLNATRAPFIAGDKFMFDSNDKITINYGGTLFLNINGAGTVMRIDDLQVASNGKLYISNLALRDFIIDAEKPLLDLGAGRIEAFGDARIGVAFRFDEEFILWAQHGEVGTKIELIRSSRNHVAARTVFLRPVIMNIDFEFSGTKIYATYNGLDFTNAGSLPGAPEDASRFAFYLERLLQAEELVALPSGQSLLSSLIQVTDLDSYIARLEEALGAANYDALLSDLSEISGVSGFVDDFTSANCAVRDKAYQSLVVRHEESGCSWTSFTEQSLGDRDEQAITSGRQAPLGEHWVSMVAGQYKKVELVDRVEGHARDSETYLLGAGLRSRAPIANVADLSVSLTMGRGEHRRNREWASVQQASVPEMNFQMVRIGASRSFALPLKGSWKITPSTDYNLVRVDVSDLQHEGSAGDRVFAVDDMEHNRQSVRVGLELRGEHESERGSSITAFARIGVEHYVNGRSAGYTIRLVGASQGFTYYGRPIDENVLTTSFGITKARGKAVSFRAFYEGKQGIGGIYENHEAKLEVLRRF